MKTGKIYKNYRSKLSTPLIRELETHELFRRNPRLIARTFKFLGYIGFLQLNAKCPKKKIGLGSSKSRETCRKFKNREVFSNLNLVSNPSYSYQYYLISKFFTNTSNNLTNSNYSFYSPNYDIQNGTRAPIFEPYNLKLASIHWTKTKEILSKKYYSKAIRILVDLGIIYCDFKSMKGEKTYWFALTETGYDLLNSSYTEYIYHKIYNTVETRNRNRRIKRKGYHNKIYADPILQNAKAAIDGIDNIKELVKIAEGLKESSRLAANHILDLIIEKDYKALEILCHTGRFYSPLHMLPKEVKMAAIINGKSLAMCLDVRSCHPTHLGLYVQTLIDFPCPELDAEVSQYNALFCDTKHHPRQVIKDQIERDYGKKLDDLQAVKDGLNHFINGSKKPIPRLFRRWLKDNYPTIFNIWNSTDTKQTGNNIAKQWERAIFRAPEVLDKANELGVIIYDNHDELLIFGSKPKAKQLVKWVKQRAVEVTGINIFLKAEDAA